MAIIGNISYFQTNPYTAIGYSIQRPSQTRSRLHLCSGCCGLQDLQAGQRPRMAQDFWINSKMTCAEAEVTGRSQDSYKETGTGNSSNTATPTPAEYRDRLHLKMWPWQGEMMGADQFATRHSNELQLVYD